MGLPMSENQKGGQEQNLNPRKENIKGPLIPPMKMHQPQGDVPLSSKPMEKIEHESKMMGNWRNMIRRNTHLLLWEYNGYRSRRGKLLRKEIRGLWWTIGRLLPKRLPKKSAE